MENSTQTIIDLKKNLAESSLPEAQKKAFIELLPSMNEEEKSELGQLLENWSKSKDRYQEEQSAHLEKLNAALEEHLKKSAREEGTYVREEFEKLDNEQNGQAISTLEAEIKNL